MCVQAFKGLEQVTVGALTFHYKLKYKTKCTTCIHVIDFHKFIINPWVLLKSEKGERRGRYSEKGERDRDEREERDRVSKHEKNEQKVFDKF